MLHLQFGRPNETGLRVLCLGAHSDDIEIGCGGTLLALLESHTRVAVRWIVFSATPDRGQEAYRSAETFLAGAYDREIEVKRFRDGYFPSQIASIKEEFETLKSFHPDLVFTHYRDDRHQDHRVVSELTWNTFRNHLILEYEIPKYDGDLGIPNCFVPLTEAIRTRKTQILLDCFPSQRGRQWFDAETFQAILRLRGMEANAPTRHAEAFYCRKAVLSIHPEPTA